MTDKSPGKSQLRVPRPGSVSPAATEDEADDFDTAALLLGLQDEIDKREDEVALAEDRDVSFQDERPAEAYLDDETRDDIEQRVAWFVEEAEAQSDLTAKGRLFVIASELCAMLDKRQTARELAARGHDLPDVARRQERQLALALGDWDFVRRALGQESEAETSNEERAHAAFYLAEIERLKTDSSAQAVRLLDQGQRSQPGDPRAALFKLARQLGSSARSPSVKWPDKKELEPLRTAATVVARLRGERRTVSRAEDEEPLLAFTEAQLALARGKAADAGRALSGLFLEPGLGPPARWLQAALLAPDPETRAEAVEALSELLDIDPTDTLRRAVATRSLEAGKLEVALQALDDDDSGDAAFSDHERVAIGALTNAPLERWSRWLSRAANDPRTLPLAWAAWRALGEHPQIEPPGTPQTRARLTLASLLASSDTEQLAARLDELSEALPDDALLSLLKLEFARQAGDSTALTSGIVELSERQGLDVSGAEYAVGLLMEIGGQDQAALEHYGRALDSATFGEAALRALQALDPERIGSKELKALASAVEGGERQAALLIEAALPLLAEPITGPGDDGDETARALAALMELAPDNPIATLLRERALFAENNLSQLSEELSQRLDQELPPFLAALTRVRLARLSPTHNKLKSWLKEALDVYPNDAALVSAFEREGRPGAIEVARLRESLAETAKTPWSKARLLLEAALFYEAAGAFSDGARVAKDSDALATSDLARQSFVRNALQSEQAANIKERWLAELSGAPEPTRIALLSQLAEFERERGQANAQQKWLQEAIEVAPQRLDLLLEAEYLALKQNDRDNLLTFEQRILEIVPDKDAVPHALLLARAERAQKGWAAAYGALQRADRGKDTSLYTLRQLQAHTRRKGDDKAIISVTLRLAERVSYAPDRAMLLLRAAEASLRLGYVREAHRYGKQALELVPNHLLLHYFLTNATPDDNPRDAAQTFEHVAERSRVAKHQAEAWYDAANLWLDKVNDTERGRLALEKAAELDPSHQRVFEQLFRLLKDRTDSHGLSQLVAQRLNVTQSAEERAELGMLQSQLLRETGNNDESRAALREVLKERPDHLPALQRLATIALEDDDASGAEQALLQLVRLTTNWDEQANSYLELGNLYARRLANFERAERCYQEVLRRKPAANEARQALLPLYLKHQAIDKARQQFNELLASLKDEAEQRTVFLEYLALVDEHLGDHPYKTELLEQALAQWTLDPEVLDLAVRHYAQRDKKDEIRAIEEHTFAEVSRKLHAGFVDAKYLKATAALSVAAGHVTQARVMQAMAGALLGQFVKLPPLFGQAMQRTLDEKLAPSPMVSPFRTLLMLTRDVLEHAFVATGHRPVVQRADSPLTKRVKSIASQAGVPAPTVCLDATFPYACWLNGARDVQLIFGDALHAEASNEELEFLIWRSLKLAQARAGVFTRLDAAQTKVATVAFLSCFVDVKLAEDWDLEMFEQVRARINVLIPKDLDDDVPVLALEALESLTKSGEHLALAARKWANRTALLATGNINAALAALTHLGGQKLSARPDERARQLSDNPETRDLVSAALLPGIVEAFSSIPSQKGQLP